VKWVASSSGINVADLGIFKSYVANPGNARFDFGEFYRNAMDFNNDAALNVADISMLQSKISNPFNPVLIENLSFLPLGTWSSGSQEILVEDNIEDIDITMIAIGDYNASANAYYYSDFSSQPFSGAKNYRETDFLTQTNDILFVDTDRFIVPMIYSEDYTEMSGLQIELEYPADKFELASVNMLYDRSNINPIINKNIDLNEKSIDNLIVTDTEGFIRIIFSEEANEFFNINNRDMMLNLEFVKSQSNYLVADDFFLYGHNSLLSTSEFEVISPVELLIPKLVDAALYISENNDIKLQLYPNPAKDIVYLEIDSNMSNILEINLMDMLGRNLSTIDKSEIQSGTNRFEIKTADLAPGLYNVQVKYNNNNNQEIVNLKLVVKD
jgi:hypothetical protein